ncbi:MAG TPA: PEP-CTERM sorting domain-containing protein [Candidatus Competibacteraceae bacterium]|nr:PEP-CTERM sorting domain-containing protein [Candidatus Competibacteraceae bacterium]
MNDLENIYDTLDNSITGAFRINGCLEMPEPVSLALMGIGIASLGMAAGRKPPNFGNLIRPNKTAVARLSFFYSFVHVKI